MDEKSRELLTGFALVALAIDRAMERSSGDISLLTRAVKELGPHRERGPSYGGVGIEQQSRGAMASAAVMLADACLVELNIKTTDPFHNQDS